MACRTMVRVAANPHQAEIANGPEPNLPNSCLGLKSERFLAAAEAAAKEHRRAASAIDCAQKTDPVNSTIQVFDPEH